MEAFHTFGDLKGIWGLAVPWVYCWERGLGFPLANNGESILELEFFDGGDLR